MRILSLSLLIFLCPSGNLGLGMYSPFSGNQGSPIMIMVTKSGEHEEHACCWLTSGLCFRPTIFLWLRQSLSKLATSPPQRRLQITISEIYIYFFPLEPWKFSVVKVIIINLWGLRYSTEIGFLFPVYSHFRNICCLKWDQPASPFWERPVQNRV